MIQVFDRPDSYRLTQPGFPDRIIPKDPANSDYQWFQGWIANGGAVEPEPEQPIIQSPDWLNFRLAMLADGGYNRLAQAVYGISPILQQRLETAMSFEQPHVPTVGVLWEQWILLCPPTEAEIDRFRQLAQACFIPFTFDDNGSIILLKS